MVQVGALAQDLDALPCDCLCGMVQIGLSGSIWMHTMFCFCLSGMVRIGVSGSVRTHIMCLCSFVFRLRLFFFVFVYS